MKSYFYICMRVPVMMYKAWVMYGLASWVDPDKAAEPSFFNRFAFLDNAVLEQKTYDYETTISEKFSAYRLSDDPEWSYVYDVRLKVFVKEGFVWSEEQHEAFKKAFCYEFNLIDTFSEEYDDRTGSDKCHSVYNFGYVNGNAFNRA